MTNRERPPKKAARRRARTDTNSGARDSWWVLAKTRATGLLKAGAASLLFLATNALVASSSALTIVQKVAALVALLLGVFQVLNSIARLHLKHWENTDLRPRLVAELFWAGLLMLVVAAAGFVFPAQPWPLAALAVLFALVAVPYELQQKAIFDIVEADPTLEHGTNFVGKLKPWRIWGSDLSFAESTKEANGRLLKLLAIPLRPSPYERLSMTRCAILWALTYCFAVTTVATCAAIGTDMLPAPPHPKPPTPGVPAANSKHGKGHKPSQWEAAKGSGSAPTSKASGANERTWEATCGSLPSYGAPQWARPQLNALYLGGALYFQGRRVQAEPPPGAEGGCTGRALIEVYANEEFVYTIGGATRSVAVDSPRFGPALFLAPAAKLVLGLIEEQLGPLGGTPRENVANGDFLSVSTELGTVMLVRQQEHQGGLPQQAYPYTELPPAAAEAWVEAMREHKTWLWPYESSADTGEQRFTLALNPISRVPLASIAYDRQERIASYAERSFAPHSDEFTLAEVTAFAQRAE